MRILLTGATSFTGFWFAKALSEGGHAVAMPIRGRVAEYTGVRAERARALSAFGEVVEGCAFGSEKFLALVESHPAWDLLAHHAAQVGDYRSPDFDVAGAVASNIHNIDGVLGRLADRGCSRVLATGSVFEPGEGAGSDVLPAFSPYGLSKALSGQAIAYYAARRALCFGKFVIPNPFGPFEEPRFTAYLMKTWFKGEVAGVKTPDYVRDNIHASLLAASYRRFAESLPASGGGTFRLSPSGYVESQGQFARRFADEIRTRLGLACELELATQLDFPEPRIRIGTDSAKSLAVGWSESLAWDHVAAYYQQGILAANRR